MITNRVSQKETNVFNPHQSSLICELSNLKSNKAKVTGIVLKIKFNESYLDITSNQMTTQSLMEQEMSSARFFSTKTFDSSIRSQQLRQYLENRINSLPSWHIQLQIHGKQSIFKNKGPKIYRNMDQYLEFVIQKLNQQQQQKEVEIICSVKKKVTSSKLFAREARNLIFVSALKVFEHNPEFVHWIFSKDAIKNQIYVKKYLAAKNISPQEAEKGISQSILHFYKMKLICESEGNRYSIYRSVFTKMQQETLAVLASTIDIIQNAKEELLHRRWQIEKQVDFIFNAEGLTKLLKEFVSEGKIFIHDTKIILA